jgi:hypothetical protein
MDRTDRKPLLQIVTAVTVCILAAPAYGDAWGASWGIVNASVTPSGANDSLIWNTTPELWGIWAEAEVYHMHPGLSRRYGIDKEVLTPLGDGIVNIGPITTGDLASVTAVETRVSSTGGPLIDMSTTRNVFSYAHDVPNSWSAASGFGQHDNVFNVEYNGIGEPPDSTTVTIQLAGSWNLEGDSDPDDYWFADWYTYVEIYDASTLEPLAWDDEYHFLEGPGYFEDSGVLDIQFDLTLDYGTTYALRFWQDDESYAIAVPGPGAIGVLFSGGITITNRRRRHE